MNAVLWIISFWGLIWAGILAHGDFLIDDAIVEKDLYRVLGLTAEATHEEIKKSYRKLAKIHHPDKAKNAEAKELNERVFRDIAEAYEILSHVEQRKAYDSMRQIAQRHKSQFNRQRDYYNEPPRGQYNEETFDFDDFYSAHPFEERMEHFSGYSPVITSSIMPAGQVIFPYAPIITSADRSHFAFLDIHCSLAVYRGDVHQMLQQLLRNQAPDMTSLAVELKFRTEGRPSLHGRCFAGLDDSGYFRVYRGQPEAAYSPLWSSDGVVSGLPHEIYFKRFYLELSNSGELAVRALTAGVSDVECVWSTTSCNVYMAMVKEVVATVAPVIQDLVIRFSEFLHRINERIKSWIHLIFVERRLGDVIKTHTDNLCKWFTEIMIKARKAKKKTDKRKDAPNSKKTSKKRKN